MAVTLNASTSSGFVQSADTSGQINLQSNGSTKLSVLSTGVSGTIVQGTAVVSTSGTSIDFTGIPSWVKRITVMFDNVSTTGSSIVQIQLGTSGGIEGTGYTGGSTYVVNASSTAGGNNSTGFSLDGIGSSANIRTGIVSIVNFNSNTWVESGVLALASSNSSMSGGAKTLSGTLDRIRIIAFNATDTFDNGQINIQYEG